jgi:signal transduction histidine kinase
MTGRYQRAVDLLELITLLQAGPIGFSIQQIADHFEVSRRTAERMLSALQRRFPELQHELRKGRKYWKFVPSGQTLSEWNGETLLSDTSATGDSGARPLQRTRWLAQSAQPRDALAGTMAEALRAPVSTIGLVARSAMDQPGADAQEALARIVALAERMNQTIERTLTLVRSEPLKIEPTSTQRLLECVHDEIRASAQARAVEIEFEVSPDLPPLRIDRSVLASAIVDLAQNAIDAMPDGGRLVVAAELAPDGQAVCISLDDTGPGVPVGDEEWIFEPFYTTKDEGTGLGLAMARQAAAEHGGKVRALAHSGPGASFRFEVPVATAESPADS